MSTNSRSDVKSVAQTIASIRLKPDRLILLNELRIGDFSSLTKTLTAAIAEEQRFRGRVAVHAPPWITEPAQVQAWQDAALAAARAPVGARQLRVFMAEYWELLKDAEARALTSLEAHRAERRPLVEAGRNVEARRDHFRGDHASPSDLTSNLTLLQIAYWLAILCETGAIFGVVGAHFGVGIGIDWSRVATGSRVQTIFMTGGAVFLSVWLARFLVHQALVPGSRLRVLGTPLAVAALLGSALVLAAVRYAGASDLASTTMDAAQLGSVGVAGLAVLIGFVGAIIAAGIGYTIERTKEERHAIGTQEARFANDIKYAAEDRAKCEEDIKEAEHNVRLPAVAATHFEQAVISAVAQLADFDTELEDRLGRAQAAFRQAASLPLADREQVDLLLRDLTPGMRRICDDGEGA